MSETMTPEQRANQHARIAAALEVDSAAITGWEITTGEGTARLTAHLQDGAVAAGMIPIAEAEAIMNGIAP